MVNRFNHRDRVVLIVLALAPVISVVAAFVFDPYVAIFVAYAAVFLPLLALTISLRDAISRRSKMILWLALACILLMPPALCMNLAPRYMINPDDSARKGIYLTPSTHNPLANAVLVESLSARYPPIVHRSEASDLAPVGYGLELWINSGPMPTRLWDNVGNGIDARLMPDGIVRVQDDRGGFADLKWDGKAFSIVASNSAGKSISARGPTSLALNLQQTGQWLLTMTPLLAWLLITWAALQMKRERGAHTGWLIAAITLQLVGIAEITWAAFIRTPGHGEGELTFAIMLGLCLSLTSLAGSLITARQLLSLAVLKNK